MVDLKDIAMLTKRHANKDNIVETQPEPNADHEYSYDTDFDSEAENPMPRDESGDEWWGSFMLSTYIVIMLSTYIVIMLNTYIFHYA